MAGITVKLEEELEDFASLIVKREEMLEDAKKDKDWKKVRDVQADLLDMADNLRHPERW